MKLFTKAQLEKLIHNGQPEQRGKDHLPVVKLFTPDAQCTWLITDIDPENPDDAFGLCDLGLGYTELGYISIAELHAIRGPFCLPVERDRYFNAEYPIVRRQMKLDKRGENGKRQFSKLFHPNHLSNVQIG